MRARFNELEWRFRHIYKLGWAKGHINPKSLSHPHRQLVIQKISSYAPFENLLEVGCATGPNLYLLSKKFPNVHFTGIDINSNAVKKGNIFFRQIGIQNVSLFVGKASDLRFKDKSFDIVLTDALLLCINPKKISKVATELQRVARKVIILVEHHSEQENALGTYREDWWIRNYKKLFQPFSYEINMTKIPPEIWGGNWGKFGYVIEFKILDRKT